MKKTKEYVKGKKPKNERRTKVTSIAIEYYQSQLLEDKKINVSLLIRDMIDDFLKQNFPGEIEIYKEKLKRLWEKKA